jgi:hypothetical protein
MAVFYLEPGLSKYVNASTSIRRTKKADLPIAQSIFIFDNSIILGFL